MMSDEFKNLIATNDENDNDTKRESKIPFYKKLSTKSKKVITSLSLLAIVLAVGGFFTIKNNVFKADIFSEVNVKTLAPINLTPSTTSVTSKTPLTFSVTTQGQLTNATKLLLSMVRLKYNTAPSDTGTKWAMKTGFVYPGIFTGPVITGLLPDTTYYFQINAGTASGPSFWDHNWYEFKTPPDFTSTFDANITKVLDSTSSSYLSATATTPAAPKTLVEALDQTASLCTLSSYTVTDAQKDAISRIGKTPLAGDSAILQSIVKGYTDACTKPLTTYGQATYNSLPTFWKGTLAASAFVILDPGYGFTKTLATKNYTGGSRSIDTTVTPRWNGGNLGATIKITGTIKSNLNFLNASVTYNTQGTSGNATAQAIDQFNVNVSGKIGTTNVNTTYNSNVFSLNLSAPF